VSTCACGKPTRDDAYICDDDLDSFARLLGEVPWIDDEIDTTIAKLRAATSGGSASAETALPYNAEASKRAGALRTALVTLVKFCDEEGVRSSDPSDGLPANTVVAMSRWLMWRVDGLAFNDMAEEFIADASAAIRDCQRIIDLPPERAYAGPCPECKRDLYHRPTAAQVKCPGCGQRWDVGEVNAWMQDRIREHMEDRLVTSREGATLLSRFGLETGQRTIDKWHERGKVSEAGHDAKGRRLFRWDELLTLAARHAKAS
jgi:hypothetical protein